MDEQNMICMYVYICIWYVYDGILLSHEKEWSSDMWHNVADP